MHRLLITAALALMSTLAQAWGADAHQTVATVAAGLLKGSTTEARVRELLDDIPLPLAAVWADCAKGIAPRRDFEYATAGQYPECLPLETPELIAEMADYVRRNDRQCTLYGEEPCHKQTHYTDVTLQRSHYRPGLTGTRPDDVVGALRQAIRVLQRRPTSGPPDYRGPREALLVLVHLVGDVHQPLHVGSVYLGAGGERLDPDQQGFDPASNTIGGNSLYIAAATATPAAKLHGLWDAVPESLRPAHVDTAWLAEARQVPVDAGDPADWPALWATQALSAAGPAFDGLVFSPRQASRWTVALPGGYDARMDAIKRQQLTIAGARLAQVLRALLR
ncbi:S1/P1 nuclease [Roseateles cellulosilyticus]|uniref:S1/P1 nuclease n=1 Tax=Pelomonas cellulosilytica TaxID=2906762 RepID=A0ABS8Y0C2_9BURK|nr:S1/P1 nuclease [Pelomonas sp. P8]MCE4557028.1 S1/P1 nuclease [Pelomonas sp. P8]